MTSEDGIKRYSKIPGNGKRLAIVGVLLLTAAGCDELLDVTLPGVVQESALNDARLANTLVLGAEGDFNCAHSFLTFMYGLWTTDFRISSSGTGGLSILWRLILSGPLVFPLSVTMENAGLSLLLCSIPSWVLERQWFGVLGSGALRHGRQLLTLSVRFRSGGLRKHLSTPCRLLIAGT